MQVDKKQLEDFVLVNIGGQGRIRRDTKPFTGVVGWIPSGRSATRSRDCVTFFLERFGGRVAMLPEVMLSSTLLQLAVIKYYYAASDTYFL